MKNSAAFAMAALLFAAAGFSRAQAPKPPEAAPKPVAGPERLVDGLSDVELDQVLNLLKSNYIKPAALSPDELKRATVAGALARIGPGAQLISAPGGETEKASPFHGEILADKIGYVRLGATAAENVTQLDQALAKLAEQKVTSLILDLRATPSSSSMEQMAEVCRRFVPKGRILFTVKKPTVKQEEVLTSTDEPKFAGVVVALVGRETAGNAEVIAAVLRTHVKAMVIGQTTKGEALEYSDFPLGSGKVLRIAVAEVALPDKTTVFPGGVKPDLTVDVPAETTVAVLKQELENGVSSALLESERPRMNEAALVAGGNPELDAVQAAQKEKAEAKAEAPKDEVLQRAVDFITALDIYGSRGAKPR